MLLSGSLGGWPPRLPGGGGVYTRAAQRLVSSAKQSKPPPPASSQGGIFWRSVENLYRIQREVVEAGERAAIAAVEVAVELSFRISAFSTGLVMILIGGWARGKALGWLLRLELRATDGALKDMEKRVRRLERGDNVRGIKLGSE